MVAIAMKTILIANTNLVALVDNEDYERVMQERWYHHHAGACLHGRYGGTTMQEFIIGKIEGADIDHIDRNRLNNQRKNLRHVTKSHSRQNRGKFKNNTTGFIGVTYHIRTGKFQAYVNKGGIRHAVGAFNDAESAAKARDIKAYELFGQFASLNFPRQ